MLMAATSARYQSVFYARLGDLVVVPGGLCFCCYRTKTRALADMHRSFIAMPELVNVLRPYAVTPERAAELAYGTQDHLDLPPLLPLPARCPTALLPFGPQEARRACIQHLVMRGEKRKDVAANAAHSMRVQERSYLSQLTPGQRSLAIRTREPR